FAVDVDEIQGAGVRRHFARQRHQAVEHRLDLLDRQQPWMAEQQVLQPLLGKRPVVEGDSMQLLGTTSLNDQGRCQLPACHGPILLARMLRYQDAPAAPFVEFSSSSAGRSARSSRAIVPTKAS